MLGISPYSLPGIDLPHLSFSSILFMPYPPVPPVSVISWFLALQAFTLFIFYVIEMTFSFSLFKGEKMGGTLPGTRVCKRE